MSPTLRDNMRSTSMSSISVNPERRLAEQVKVAEFILKLDFIDTQDRSKHAQDHNANDHASDYYDQGFE